MADSTEPGVTQILLAAQEGEPASIAQLLPLVYDELPKLAHARMSRQRGGRKVLYFAKNFVS